MKHPFLLSIVLASLVGCGGGDEALPAMTSHAPAGAVRLPSGDASSITYGLTSLAYTNASDAAQLVRINAVGGVRLSGQAEASTSIRYRIENGSEVRLAQTGAEVTLLAGQTIAASVFVTLENATGEATLDWSDVSLTLQPL